MQCLVGMFDNRQSAFLWVITVPPSHRRQTSTGASEEKGNEASPFHLPLYRIDDVLSLNNCKFGDLVDRIYPIELEIKDTTDTELAKTQAGGDFVSHFAKNEKY